MPLSPGDVVDAKYRIERKLGQGGMGVVYAAEEIELARRVAIKVLLASGNEEAIARFDREARAAAALASDHAVRIFGVGVLPAGRRYMVMEFLDGEDLGETLERSGPLPVAEALRVVCDACDAVEEAHSRGIIHRDLKPANLFYARRPSGNVTVKVLDFGISKALAETRDAAALTSTSAVMGTPLYMSPEQLKETKSVDARTDIWALGATLYELVTGVPPFRGDSIPELHAAILVGELTPMAKLRPDVPPELDAVVARCLQKLPDDRFATARDLAGALRALPAAQNAHAPRPVTQSVTAPLPRPADGAATKPLELTTNRALEAAGLARAPRRHLAAGLLGAVAVFALGVGAKAIVNRPEPEPALTSRADDAVDERRPPSVASSAPPAAPLTVAPAPTEKPTADARPVRQNAVPSRSSRPPIDPSGPPPLPTSRQ